MITIPFIIAILQKRLLKEFWFPMYLLLICTISLDVIFIKTVLIMFN